MALSLKQIQENVEEIFRLYQQYGSEDYGENVSQLMHMMQAAQHAKLEGAVDEMVIAAFLHDIGHFIESENTMDIYGNHAHDQLGGAYLIGLGFNERMARLVSSHVLAKRYLTFKDSNYYETLSEASKITLQYQGGPMNADEAILFEADPLKDLYIKIRYWDDLGKTPEIEVTSDELNQMRALIIAYLLKQESQT